MSNEKIFADGMRFEPPGEKAPEWVKGKISILAPKFIEFLQKHQNEKGWLNLDVKQSQKGGYYVELNTWKKGQVSAAPADPGGVIGAEDEEPF